MFNVSVYNIGQKNIINDGDNVGLAFILCTLTIIITALLISPFCVTANNIAFTTGYNVLYLHCILYFCRQPKVKFTFKTDKIKTVYMCVCARARTS